MRVIKDRLFVERARMRGLQPSDYPGFRLGTIEGIQYIDLPWTWEVCLRLSAVGLRVPSPMIREYDWPIKAGWQPFKHQIKTANFLALNARSFNTSSIGTSKTLSAIWASDYLQSKHEVRSTLVIAPLSTLWCVWDNELFDTLVPRGKTVAVLHGSRARRAQLLAEAHDYYIINHDGIKILEQELIDKEEIDLIILDEFAQFRNAKTAKYKALAKVAAISTGRKLWQLSGTPAPTAPTDVWSLAKLSNPNNVPKYFTRFRDLLMKQVNQFKWVPKNGWEVVATAAIQPSIRFEREHCIDIPATMYETRTAEMSKEQTKAYKKMVEEYVIQAREGLITAANEGVKLQKLMQIATGAVYTVDRTVVEYDVSPKFKVLMDLIEEAGNKAIVFTPFKHSIKLLAEALKRKNLSVGVVNGDVSPRKRSEIFTAFQKYELDLLLAHPKTMSHGLTLTASNVIIWWGPTDFETYDQACGRITRSGQKGTPLIVQITCSPVEERAYKRLRNKESTQGLLLELLTS